MMIPALAHATAPRTMVPPAPAPCSPERDVTWTVRLPWLVSGWRSRVKLSTTASPPGPVGTAGMQAGPDLEALTNARRHAPGAAVDVELHYTSDTLDLRVRD